jgi:two-component system, NtrC family, response regulator AlgB
MAMKLLLIGDERKNRRLCAWGFASPPYAARSASTRQEAEKLLEEDSFHAACVDWKMEADDPAALVDLLRDRLPALPIIAFVGEKHRRLAPLLKQVGVAAHLVSPFAIEELHSALGTHALASPIGAPKPHTPPRIAPTSVAATAPAQDETARRIMEIALRAANSHAAILILGETGTGKSVLAQTIHQNSPIRDKPFVTVNCPCLSHELLESDLFGHVRGSFTGAVQDTWGKVALAEGGTLFLDEIGDLPMSLQPKLLRLLQEKQYERVGEATSRTANVRIVAATNRDLKREVAAGRFREDLYYRINVIAIDVPPLRSRPGQIVTLAATFLDAISRQLGRANPGLSAEARQMLESYDWPGNLRELRNVVERAAILSNGAALQAADFPGLIARSAASRYQIGGPISLQALENAHIRMVVASSSSLEEAARILEIDKSTLYRKRKQMESASVPEFAPSLATLTPLAAAIGG